MRNDPSVELVLSGAGTAEELHEILFRDLSLPTYYGRNWDAFWDVIASGDGLPPRLVLRGWAQLEQRLPREAELLRRCLIDYASERRDRPCEVVFA